MAEEAAEGVANLELRPRAENVEVDGDDYKAPDAKSIGELLSTAGKKGEDAALQRYKSQLLGDAVLNGAAGSSDPRIVVIKELTVVINGDRPPLTFDMTDEQNLEGGLSFTLKEGCEYRMQLSFVVQNEIVSGLKYKNVVSRGPITVLKVDEMLGSYGPDPAKLQTVVFPRREWNEAPSGMGAPRTRWPVHVKSRSRCHMC